MLTRVTTASLCVLCVASLYTQGRSAPDWTTGGADAQRSSWISADPWISLDTISNLTFLWKVKLDNETRQQNALTEPVTMANLNSFRGLKSLVFVGGSSNNAYAIDYDFGTLFWKTHFNYSSGVAEFAGSPACPGGMTAGLTRATNLTPASQLSLMGFARPPRPARGEVGEPGKGAPQLVPDTQSGGRGGAAGGGRGAPPPAAAAPPTPAAAPAGRGRGTNAVFALAGDGLLRALSPANGDAAAAPVKFLPPNATASGLIQADGVVYAVTSSACGNAQDAVWAMDWEADDKPVTSWRSNGAPIAGAALGSDGTVYAAAGDGTSAYASSVVALEAKTLKLKDWFTQSGARFDAPPVVFSDGDKTYVAAAGEGRLFVLDGGALGGADHKTPLATASTAVKPGFSGGPLATWRDSRGTRWILAATRDKAGNGSVVAFTFGARNGAPTLEHAWTSRDLTAPAGADRDRRRGLCALRRKSIRARRRLCLAPGHGQGDLE